MRGGTFAKRHVAFVPIQERRFQRSRRSTEARRGSLPTYRDARLRPEEAEGDRELRGLLGEKGREKERRRREEGRREVEENRRHQRQATDLRGAEYTVEVEARPSGGDRRRELRSERRSLPNHGQVHRGHQQEHRGDRQELRGAEVVVQLEEQLVHLRGDQQDRQGRADRSAGESVRLREEEGHGADAPYIVRLWRESSRGEDCREAIGLGCQNGEPGQQQLGFDTQERQAELVRQTSAQVTPEVVLDREHVEALDWVDDYVLDEIHRVAVRHQRGWPRGEIRRHLPERRRRFREQPGRFQARSSEYGGIGRARVQGRNVVHRRRQADDRSVRGASAGHQFDSKESFSSRLGRQIVLEEGPSFNVSNVQVRQRSSIERSCRREREKFLQIGGEASSQREQLLGEEIRHVAYSKVENHLETSSQIQRRRARR